MTTATDRLVFALPRAAAIALIGFLGLFSLDVFQAHAGFWPTVGGLLVHNIPGFVLALVVALAWRREWIGGVLFAAAGIAYILMIAARPAPPLPVRLGWMATISGPAFVVAGLFFLGWARRRRSGGPTI